MILPIETSGLHLDHPLWFWTCGLSDTDTRYVLLENQLLPSYWTILDTKRLTHGGPVTFWPYIPSLGWNDWDSMTKRDEELLKPHWSKGIASLVLEAFQLHVKRVEAMLLRETLSLLHGLIQSFWVGKASVHSSSPKCLGLVQGWFS